MLVLELEAGSHVVDRAPANPEALDSPGERPRRQKDRAGLVCPTLLHHPLPALLRLAHAALVAKSLGRIRQPRSQLRQQQTPRRQQTVWRLRQL